MSAQNRSKFLAIVALILLSGILGYNWVIMKVAVKYANPVAFSALRTFFGAVTLFVVMLALQKPLQPKAVMGTFLLGLLQTSGFVGFATWALVSGGAGKTAVLVYTMPFWSLLFGWIALGERIRGVQWIAIAFGSLGLLFVLDPLHLNGGAFSKVLALLSGISWAASAIVAKKLHQTAKLDLLSLTAWQTLFGSIPLVAIALSTPSTPIVWSHAFIGALIYNVIPGTALSWLLWAYVLRQLSTGVAGLGTLATPIVGVLAAWLQLGERPGVADSIGIVLIAVALLVLSLQGLRQMRQAKLSIITDESPSISGSDSSI
jgi:drug/metabolite transporter (DMT)-like permease